VLICQSCRMFRLYSYCRE